MNAIRQFYEVKNNSFNVVLPEGFNAEKVEVIIIASEKQGDIPQCQKNILDERLQHFLENPNDVMDFDSFIDSLEKEL